MGETNDWAHFPPLNALELVLTPFPLFFAFFHSEKSAPSFFPNCTWTNPSRNQLLFFFFVCSSSICQFYRKSHSFNLALWQQLAVTVYGCNSFLLLFLNLFNCPTCTTIFGNAIIWKVADSDCVVADSELESLDFSLIPSLRFWEKFCSKERVGLMFSRQQWHHKFTSRSINVVD